LQQYHDALRTVLEHGVRSTDRTGTGTLSHFGLQSRYPLADGFPLVTTKKLHLRSIVHELLWFLSGDTNIAYLRENGVSIWDEWADEKGDLGPVYGQQWRAFPTATGQVDQIAKLIEMIARSPDSRRLIVSAWNPGEVDAMALPPCHWSIQVDVIGDRLNLLWNQRSVDTMLGLPFNIASYALLLHLLAKESGFKEGKLVGFLGDTHIYETHFEGAKEQLTRSPMKLPRIKTENFTSIFDWTYTDIIIEDYESHPRISFPIAV